MTQWSVALLVIAPSNRHVALWVQRQPLAQSLGLSDLQLSSRHLIHILSEKVKYSVV